MKASERYFEKVKEIKTQVVGAIVNENAIQNMREEEFTLLKTMMDAIDASIEMEKEREKMLEEMNEKLDKLMKRSIQV